MRTRFKKVRRLIAVLAAGKRWLRSCDDCRAYQHYESGAEAGTVETTPRPDGKGGCVHLPMARVGMPPCDDCPKIDPDETVKHWSKATDFEPWFWEAWDDFGDRRMCGTLAEVDPLLLSVFRQFDRHARALEAHRAAEPVLKFLSAAFSAR